MFLHRLVPFHKMFTPENLTGKNKTKKEHPMGCSSLLFPYLITYLYTEKWQIKKVLKV